MITLYTWPTPNGHKAQIGLEELGLPYDPKPVNITKGEQFEPQYVSINPNGKVPVIVDDDGPDGMEHKVFESGAILLYLAEKTGQLLSHDLVKRSQTVQWLMWQMGGLGPMMGQAQHFHRYAPAPIPYSIDRYQKETKRLLRVLETRLAQHEYIVDDYSIADIACFPWVRIHTYTGVSLDEYPNIVRWFSAVRARPAVGRALDLFRADWVDVTKSDEAKRNLFAR
jgi:GST-like protein